MKTLLTKSKIWTGEGYFPDTIGFDSMTGEVTFIGNESVVNIKEYDEVIDTNGKLILPAFYEGHCHLVKGSTVKKELNLRTASTKNDFVNIIGKYKSELKPGKWIQGGYFTESEFTENFYVDRNLLDEICPDIPILIQRIDIHSAIVNSKAIEIAGLELMVSKFGTDEIILDEKGNLTGEIKERAMFFAIDKIPPLTFSEISSIVDEEIRYLHSLGITSVTDITYPVDLEVYKILLKSNNLNLRINSCLPFENFYEFENLTKNFSGYENIKFNSFKAYYDGSLSSESAYFFENYKNKNHNGTKSFFVNSGEFDKTGIDIDKAEKQIVVHAIGDRAISEVLDFAENLNDKNGKRDRRLRIEHLQHINPKDYKRFNELDIIMSVQPSHLYVDGKIADEKLNNPEFTHNYKPVVNYGRAIIFGTDFPVANESPFETIYYALTRKAKDIPEGFYRKYALDINTCINAYTFNNAYACFEENIAGKLKEGFLANIIILENNLFEIPHDEIKDAKVNSTYFYGKRVF
ncbi:MAG: amidohydrolase [Ignavibacteria bacterium]|nr:amidohydrolase [Ignavibacteria bacterium]